MNPTDLLTYINDHDIDAEIIFLDEETMTVADAAAALQVTPAQIIKSIAFLAEGEPVLAITNGVSRVGWKTLADYLDVSRRQLRMADPAQVQEMTGYEVGAVPPFGHPQPLRTLIDTAVFEQSVIFGGGGATNALIRLTPQELQRVVEGEVAALAERE